MKIGKNQIIFDNVKIGKNVQMENCVIGENCIINTHSNLKNSVIGANEKISEKTVLENEVVWNQSIPNGYPKKQIGNVLGE